MWHWEGLGKCSQGSALTWSLSSKFTGLVNNVLTKMRKMQDSFPDLSLFSCVTFPSVYFFATFCHRNINNGAIFPKFWSLSVTSSIVTNRFQMLNFTYNLYCSEVTYIFHHWPRVAISKHCACFLLRLKWATNERVLQYSTHQEEGHKQ